jgi:hypothetical protein
LFLYKHVPDAPLGWVEQFERTRRPSPIRTRLFSDHFYTKLRPLFFATDQPSRDSGIWVALAGGVSLPPPRRTPARVLHDDL